MAKKLIINADDFGLRGDINYGIIKCYREGAVTDISLMAAGDLFYETVELARKNDITKVGIHLTLTGSLIPASPIQDVLSLVTKDGKFPRGYAEFFARFFTGRVSKKEIYKEFKNQILRVKKEGFKISHLNSHEHIHAVPSILKIAAGLMKEENIEYLRFPREKINIFTKFADPKTLIRNTMLSSMCLLAGRVLRSSGVKHNDYFVGHGRALRLRRKDWMNAISSLNDGLTEVGCHPISSKEELEVLCDPGFIEELKRRSIELVSY